MHVTTHPYKEQVFVMDIDGTIADRKDKRGPFDEHLVIYDEPIIPVVKVLHSLRKDYKIIFLSGRSEKCRKDTELWLEGVLQIDNPTLFMRAAGDHRNDAIVKKELYDIHLSEYNVIGIFDDRDRVCHMWVDNGIFLFNVSQFKGNF